MDEFLAMLDEGFPITDTDSNKNTLLHIACQNDHLDIVEICVAHGADVNAQNKTGQTALHFSRYYEYDDIFKFLIKNGAELIVMDPRRNGLENYA